MPELETVDIPAVEILSAGGPVHGVGSPPEGDFWTKDDLQAIAAANRELADELKAPSKIGHTVGQVLLQNSGLPEPTPGEMPAVGWLDGATFDVVERDGVAKLVADLKDVPKQFAQLLETKAYRTRSVELSKVTSQELTDDAGKPRVFEWVVSGLAWLGGKLPAVRTLDDIVALYEQEELGDPSARVFVVYAEGDVVWDPEAGFQDLRDDVGEALNGVPTGGMNEPRFWVADIAVTLDQALVQDYYGDSPSDAWVVPFTRSSDDTITIAPSSDWTPVEQGWVESAREFEQAASNRKRRADIRRDVPETTYTAEQRKTFAEATGLDEDKVTDEMLTAAGVAVETDEDDPKRDLEADERMRKLEEEQATTKRELAESKEALRVERRAQFVDAALKDGRIEPGQREQVEKLYDADPESAKTFVDSLPPNEEFAREYGTSEDDDTETPESKAYEAHLATLVGSTEGLI